MIAQSNNNLNYKPQSDKFNKNEFKILALVTIFLNYNKKYNKKKLQIKKLCLNLNNKKYK